MTSIRIDHARRWGVLLAGFALVASACSYAGSGGVVTDSAAAPTPVALAAGAPSAAPPTSTSGGGRYSGGDYDYGGGAASAAPSAAASAASGGAADAAAVKVASGAVGKFLTGANGMTLYIFKKDSKDKSACTGDCATNWPPFVVAAGATVTPGDAVMGTLTTFKRDDGTMQVAYNGAPLYYFVADQAAGDTNGQDVEDFVVAVP